ncbi:hypothetical protein PRIPAC_84564 [Pristionchus pacificus]|uniref:Large ribosomal subunit protein uL29 n=1 Tax=Pristionchus pacificus TaxID=54126 RepID=A0A2A6BLH0_PRIPA|nr:hypothetical protein PRIPAC_84564 [Pristionchus pacificus]|eukprot:PDM66772.1 hypothetical protein PRIPAC_48189 [Pristionchus pacificus]
MNSPLRQTCTIEWRNHSCKRAATVVYVSGGAASKLSKIRVVRKNIRDQTDGQRAVLCVALSPSSRLPSRQRSACPRTSDTRRPVLCVALTKHEASIKSAKQPSSRPRIIAPKMK